MELCRRSGGRSTPLSPSHPTHAYVILALATKRNRPVGRPPDTSLPRMLLCFFLPASRFKRMSKERRGRRSPKRQVRWQIMEADVHMCPTIRQPRGYEIGSPPRCGQKLPRPASWAMAFPQIAPRASVLPATSSYRAFAPACGRPSSRGPLATTLAGKRSFEAASH